MRVLLITTLPNRVHRAISGLGHIRLHVVACNEYRMVRQRVEKQMSTYDFDLLITYRCPYIVPDRLIEKVNGKAFNLHPSLLPKYAGANPWEEIFAAKEKYNGLTLHKITNVIDSGEIVLQRRYVISTEDTLQSARDKADSFAADLLVQWLGQYNGDFIIGV